MIPALFCQKNVTWRVAGVQCLFLVRRQLLALRHCYSGKKIFKSLKIKKKLKFIKFIDCFGRSQILTLILADERLESVSGIVQHEDDPAQPEGHHRVQRDYHRL